MVIVDAPACSVVDEVVEQPIVLGQLEPQRAAQRQVLVDGVANRRHRAPPTGHGMITMDSSAAATEP
jgi:hypothetical protein